jgi:uncharacterized protein YdeI (YjbR/CyaY-like superfamily)
MKTEQANPPEVLSFKTDKAFEKWLSKNYDREEGIWLKFFKKDSGIKTVNYAEALDVALCYGWIDGLVNKFDEQAYIQKFTPRRKRSMWSKRNIEHVGRLTEEGRMKAPGLAEVERAKADGRWQQAYDSPKNMTLPDDFLKQLKKNKKANAFYKTLSKANQYAIAWRLQTAKKAETKEKRMKQILEMLEREEKFH